MRLEIMLVPENTLCSSNLGLHHTWYYDESLCVEDVGKQLQHWGIADAIFTVEVPHDDLRLLAKYAMLPSPEEVVCPSRQKVSARRTSVSQNQHAPTPAVRCTEDKLLGDDVHKVIELECIVTLAVGLLERK